MGIALTDEQLKSVASLSLQLVEAQDMVEAAEERLKAQKEKLRVIEQVALPDLMTELGVEGLTLSDGTSISIKPMYGASITKDHEGEAFDWLKEHGFGDLIKERMVVNVHPMTLRAWYKERVEAGEEVPDTLFSGFVGRKAVVKLAQ